MTAAAVVLYNPGIEEIKTIRKYYQTVDRVFVLDNSDCDNYRAVMECVKEKKEHVVYHHFGRNVGLCRAMNYGISMAFESGCEWILLMDDDSIPSTDIVKVYTDYIKENSENCDNVAVLSPIHIHSRSKAKPYEGNKPVRWAMTSGCFYNIKIFRHLGGFQEALFVDGLDMEYCYRAVERGYRVIECGRATVLHYPAETRKFSVFGIDIIKYGYSSPTRYYMQCRSLIWILLRYRYFETLIYYIWRWVKVLFFFEDKKEFLRQMISGTKEGVFLYRQYKKVSSN